MYVASTNGIHVYGLNKSKPTIIHEKTYLNGIEVLDIAFDNEKRIWAGTNQNGLYIVDGDNAEKINILKNKANLQTIRSIAFDNNNLAIIASEGDGLIIIDESLKLIKKYLTSQITKTL